MTEELTIVQPENDIMDLKEACIFLNCKDSWLYDHTSRCEPIVPHTNFNGLQFSRIVCTKWRHDRTITTLNKKKPSDSE